MVKVCVIGCGRLGSIAARALRDGTVQGAELVGVMGRSPEEGLQQADTLACPAAADISALMALEPDFVIEAAAGKCIELYGETILSGGADLISVSTGAFGDATLYQRLENVARASGRHIYLASGVVGGFDIMETARLMGGLTGSFTKTKPASGSGVGDPALRRLVDRCQGTAAQAYNSFPDHLNVAVSVALGTNGTERTPVAVETGSCVSFTTRLTGAFGRAEIYTELGTVGPDMAAYSALAVLKRVISPISF